MKILEGLPELKPGLTREEEDCLARHRTAENSRNTLVLHNMREAFVYARRCCREKLPEDAIYSLCYESLQQAARNFQPGRVRFFAYAKAYVRGAVSQEWRKLDVVSGSSMRADDSCENAETHYVEESQMQYGMRDNNSILYENGEFVDPEFEAIAIREQWALIKPIIDAKLNAQERMVLDLRYQGGFDFQKIGNLLGVTRSGVQNTHARALKKIRNELYRRKQLFNQ